MYSLRRKKFQKLYPRHVQKHSGDHQGKPFPFSSHWETGKGSEIQDSNFRKETASPGGLRHSPILKSSHSQVFPRSAHRSCNNRGAKPGCKAPRLHSFKSRVLESGPTVLELPS